jgi:hypothetical protein
MVAEPTITDASTHGLHVSLKLPQAGLRENHARVVSVITHAYGLL